MAGIAHFRTENFPHGTRARYTRKCRCVPCRKANADYYRQRKATARASVADLKPNRPKFEHSLTAFGRSTPDGRRQVVVNVAMCPGVNRRKCVQGGAWLKNGGPACVACIERATVWNGLVGTTKVRRHLRKLSAMGIGRRAIAAACDVSATIILEVESGGRRRSAPRPRSASWPSTRALARMARSCRARRRTRCCRGYSIEGSRSGGSQPPWVRAAGAPR